VVVNLPLDQIHEPPGERASRRHYDTEAIDELAASLLQHGQLQPICVRPLAPDRYEVIYGTRRLRAARLAGWTVIACTLRSGLDDDQVFVLAFAEYLQRQQLSGGDRAHSLRLLSALHTPGHTGGIRAPRPDSAAGLARRLGVAATTINSWLGLAHAPEVLEAVEAELIDFYAGQSVAGVSLGGARASEARGVEPRRPRPARP
jgi:ParB family chromosome partitioning protein